MEGEKERRKKKEERKEKWQLAVSVEVEGEAEDGSHNHVGQTVAFGQIMYILKASLPRKSTRFIYCLKQGWTTRNCVLGLTGRVSESSKCCPRPRLRIDELAW